MGEARDAITAHLEALRADGQPTPEETIIASVRLPEPSSAA